MKMKGQIYIPSISSSEEEEQELIKEKWKAILKDRASKNKIYSRRLLLRFSLAAISITAVLCGLQYFYSTTTESNQSSQQSLPQPTKDQPIKFDSVSKGHEGKESIIKSERNGEKAMTASEGIQHALPQQGSELSQNSLKSTVPHLKQGPLLSIGQKQQENQEIKVKTSTSPNQPTTAKAIQVLRAEDARTALRIKAAASQRMNLDVLINRRSQFFLRSHKVLQRMKQIPSKAINLDKNGDTDLRNISKRAISEAVQKWAVTVHTPLKESTAEVVFQKQRRNYNALYEIDRYNELPICVVVPSFMNKENLRYYYNLDSILNQRYSNFHVIIIDDFSQDGTAQCIAAELQNRNIPTEKALLIRNNQRKYHMENIYTTVHTNCKPEEILMIVDGDDALIGRQVFKLFNAVYRRNSASVVYSNYLDIYRQKFVSLGISEPYPQSVIEGNSYRRHEKHCYSHLSSMLVSLFLKIKVESLQDKSGNWFQVAVDNAIYFSAMEMACGKVFYVNEICYKYSTDTGHNIIKQDRRIRASIVKQISQKQGYQCMS